MGENPMKERHDLNDYQAIPAPAEGISTASRTADEWGQPFILPWRLNPNAAQQRWQEAGDASCGCGPVE